MLSPVAASTPKIMAAAMAKVVLPHSTICEGKTSYSVDGSHQHHHSLLQPRPFISTVLTANGITATEPPHHGGKQRHQCHTATARHHGNGNTATASNGITAL